MQNEFSRTETLIGKDALDKLKTNRIAIFGIGGVGGYVVEALARSGVGELDLIDNDTVSITNINRQIKQKNCITLFKPDFNSSAVIAVYNPLISFKNFSN